MYLDSDVIPAVEVGVLLQSELEEQEGNEAFH
jgi:hypothetical protein